MEEIKKMVDLKKSADFDKCIEVARQLFTKYFTYDIQNLLYMFPEDHKDKEGQPFWSGPKRAPHAIFFDPTDPLHAHFVTACANLLAATLGIPQKRDPQGIAQKASHVPVPAFQPKVMKVELPGEENKN
jgi:ubiquitin-activating enzyme E1